MKLLYRENQIPTFTPYNVAILKRKAVKLSRVKILIVLRMRMATDKIIGFPFYLTMCQTLCVHG